METRELGKKLLLPNMYHAANASIVVPGDFTDIVTGPHIRLKGHKRARGQKWHSGIPIIRPSLCNMYMLLNFKLLC